MLNCQRITRTDLRAWGACYYKEHYGSSRVNALVPPEGLTPRQVVELDIPVSDRLWVLETLPLDERRHHARLAVSVREAMRHTANVAVLAACEHVASLCESVAAGGPQDVEMFQAARAAAASVICTIPAAARSAARAAARAAQAAASWKIAALSQVATRAAATAAARAAVCAADASWVAPEARCGVRTEVLRRAAGAHAERRMLNAVLKILTSALEEVVRDSKETT